MKQYLDTGRPQLYLYNVVVMSLLEMKLRYCQTVDYSYSVLKMSMVPLRYGIHAFLTAHVGHSAVLHNE
jgi:hypothetical protein